MGGCEIRQVPLTTLSLEVKPSSQAGSYRLSGRSNLPDGTSLTVQGLRQLGATSAQQTPDQPEHYAILDRKVVVVNQGQWETTLQLWQAGPAGNPAETWQIRVPGGDRRFQPDREVIFTAKTPPSRDDKILERQWEASKQNPAGEQVEFLEGGQWSLQVEQRLTVTPPPVSQQDAKAGVEAIALHRPPATETTATPPDTQISAPPLDPPVSTAPPNPEEQLR